MSTFITVTAVGRLGGDATLKMTPDGRPVVEFSMAIDARKGGKDAPPTWYRVSNWGDTAVKLLPYLLKGTLVGVIGNPAPARAYQRQDGTAAASNDIFANSVQLLSSGQRPADANSTEATTTDETVDFADANAVPI